MYIDSTFPPRGRTRLEHLMRIVRRFERDELEAAIDELMVLLDEVDGDPDEEWNGDELDASGSAEEDWEGIQIQGDRAAGAPEDAEDEDSDRCEAGDDGCGQIFGEHGGTWGSEHEDCDAEGGSWAEGERQGPMLHPICNDGAEEDAWDIRKIRRDRVRRTRCRWMRSGQGDYTLSGVAPLIWNLGAAA